MRSEVEEESCEEEEQGGWAADDMFGEREEEEKREGEVQTQVWRPVVFSLSNHPYEPTYSYLFLTGIF